MNWDQRVVAVTGAAGFIGSHLCKRLVDLGATILPLDIRYRERQPWRVLGLENHQVNAIDMSRVDNILYWIRHETRPKPDIVFHLAGVSHIDQAQGAPLKAWSANVQTAWNLLEACRSYQIKAIVLASSNHVYGPILGERTRPYIEEDRLRADDVYGTSKACADLIARCYAAMGLPVASLRHVNAYGPADPHESHLVTGTILSLLKDERPVLRSNGTPIKGYLHVDDVVNAYLLIAAGLFDDKIPRQPYNAAPVLAWPALTLVDKVIQASGKDLVPDVQGTDLSQSYYREMLDPTRLSAATGWKPAWSLEGGLKATYEWYRNNGGMAWLAE